MNIDVFDLERIERASGWLLKILMNRQLTGDKSFGEIYLSVAAPGQQRGGHYHTLTTEWFCAIQGAGQLTLFDVDSNEMQHVPLDAARPQTVLVPPRVAHLISNHSQEPLMVLAYADIEYDAAHPDVVPVPMTEKNDL